MTPSPSSPSSSGPADLVWRGLVFPLPVPAHKRKLLIPRAGTPERYATEPLMLVNVERPADTAPWLKDHQWHRLVRGQLSGGRQMDRATEAVLEVSPGRVTVSAFEGGPMIEAELAPDLEPDVATNRRLLVIVAERPTLEDLRQIPKRPDAFVHSVSETMLSSGPVFYTVSTVAGGQPATV